MAAKNLNFSMNKVKFALDLSNLIISVYNVGMGINFSIRYSFGQLYYRSLEILDAKKGSIRSF